MGPASPAGHLLQLSLLGFQAVLGAPQSLCLLAEALGLGIQLCLPGGQFLLKTPELILCVGRVHLHRLLGWGLGPSAGDCCCALPHPHVAGDSGAEVWRRLGGLGHVCGRERSEWERGTGQRSETGEDRNGGGQEDRDPESKRSGRELGKKG